MAKKSTKKPKSKKAGKPRTPRTATAPEAVADAASAEVPPSPPPPEPEGQAPEALAAPPSDATGVPQADAPDSAGEGARLDETSATAPVEEQADATAVGSEEAPADADVAEAADSQTDDQSSPTDAAQTDSAPSETEAAADDSQGGSQDDSQNDSQGVSQGVSQDDSQVEMPVGDAPGDETAEASPESAEADQASVDGSRLESIIESLLFASDKALSLGDLKRLLGERDGKKVTAAVQSLIEKRKDTGIQIVTLSTGWHVRTHVDNAAWVSRLLVGRPVRLSRAMMETLAIVAYRQPVTRPEVDDIRGVDCGPVLKTLLDRGFIRIIGKKEEVGRPLLYGTTPEFLRVFNLRDLSELPTLREFYDLSAEDQSRVDSEHGTPEVAPTPSATTAKPVVALTSVPRGALAPEPEDADPLLDELDEASKAAKQALGSLGAESGEDAAEEPPREPGQEPKPEQDESPQTIE